MRENAFCIVLPFALVKDHVRTELECLLGHVNLIVCFTSRDFPNPISQPGKKTYTENKIQDNKRLNSL